MTMVMMKMNDAGISDDKIYSYILRETDFILSDLISEIVRHGYSLARFDMVISILNKMLNLLKPFNANEIKIIDKVRKARSKKNEKEIITIHNDLVQEINTLLKPGNYSQLLRLKLLLILATPYEMYENDCEKIMHNFFNYMMEAGVPYGLVYTNLRQESVQNQIW